VVALMSAHATGGRSTMKAGHPDAGLRESSCRRRRPDRSSAIGARLALTRGVYAPHGNLRILPRRRLVALSFDDGPWPAYTTAVLRDLRRAHAHATFFVVGLFASRFPGLLRAEAAAGNEVANHTYDHQQLTTSAGDRLRLSTNTTRGELARTDRAICRAGLPQPLLFRPPYGRGVFSHQLAMIVHRRGQRVIGWDVSIEHYLTPSRPLIHNVKLILDRVRPGAILLGHDGRAQRGHVLAALPALLEKLHGLGYRVITVSQLLRSAGKPSQPGPHRGSTSAAIATG